MNTKLPPVGSNLSIKIDSVLDIVKNPGRMSVGKQGSFVQCDSLSCPQTMVRAGVGHREKRWIKEAVSIRQSRLLDGLPLLGH